MKSVVVMFLGLLLHTSAYSRGPYLPDNDAIMVPYGTVIAQAGFDREVWFEDGYWDEEEDEEFFRIPGLILIKGEFAGYQFYETAQVIYRCVLVNDGPYGAMSCDQAAYLPVTAKRYYECDPRPDEFEFECY